MHDTRAGAVWPAGLGPDRAAHRLDQPLADRKAKAGARALTVASGDAVEHVEHPRLFGGRNAGATVGDRRVRRARPCRRAAMAMVDPLGRILGGIVEDVDQHLFQQHAVGKDQRQAVGHRST